jgi:hypothetical protein
MASLANSDEQIRKLTKVTYRYYASWKHRRSIKMTLTVPVCNVVYRWMETSGN